MRKLTLAAVTLAALGFTAAMSTAQAENYWGPLKVGDQCWHKQLGNSLGYWTPCDSAKEAQASAHRQTGRKARR